MPIKHGIVFSAVLVLLLGTNFLAYGQTPCSFPIANPVLCENSQPGNPWTEWDVSGAGDPSIQGFATSISVNKGETIRFKVDTPATAYRIDIYRLGYYQGLGARKITTVFPSASLPQNQPACLNDPVTGLIDCGNWAESASWSVPTSAVSGLYIAKLVRTDTGGASHIPFVVRDDSSQADILFQTSDTTWQAYNEYGGNSLYAGAPAGRAYKVSYNRPFVTRGNWRNSWIFDSEYPMIRWLERNGFNVSYISGVDTDRRGNLLFQHKVFLSVGHDEYWSADQRANVESARNAGVHLAFFSGNEIFWKIRWENSIDGSNTPFRTMVSYKETHANAKIDPTPIWTGTWRDPRFSPPADGGRPENALTGTLFRVNCCQFNSITVSASHAKLRFWRNTGLETLANGQSAVVGNGIVGYEWDEAPEDANRPQGLMKLSSTTVNLTNGYLTDLGSTYGAGTATHSLTLYRHSNGALVFGAGTVRWAWGLDDDHDNDATNPGFMPPPDPVIQQATINLLADMGVQPGSLQPGLVPASASADTVPPVANIASPQTNGSVESGKPYTVTGTASDSGGHVAVVELSFDNGATWHPASGRSSWSYSWTPGSPGTATIQARAIDDSGNFQAQPTTVTVTITPRSCPCSLWSDATIPAVVSDPDGSSIELGLRFYAEVDGYINGVRFYKGPGNTGTHTASLWSESGALLATAQFTNETASGWQQVNFASPVAINANTNYVVSYHTNVGAYSSNSNYFLTGFENSPLRAPASSPGRGNGLYRYGASGFPNQTYNANNYWVDVVFTRSTPDTIAPIVSSVSPAANATKVAVSTTVAATFSETISTATLSFQLRDPNNMPVPASVSYDPATRTAVLTPNASLAEATTYTATVQVADVAGNTMAPYSWTFTTYPATSLWENSIVSPLIDQDTQPIEVGVRFSSDISGYIRGVRFYKGAGNTGSHVANLWSSTGTLLATATFVNETAAGWQEALFPVPVPITANTQYIASYYAPNGHFSYTPAYFLNAGQDNAPLHAPASAANAGNGLFKFGSSGFPTQTYNGNNYWVDVVFSNTFVDSVPPAVTSTAPADNATKVGVGTVVTAVFNEPVNSSSIDFQLRTSAGTLVSATVNYNASTRTATLTPNAPLAFGTSYTASVSATDQAGNSMTTPATWSFTTLSCPCNLWNNATTPAVLAADDTAAVEVGVKFQSELPGYITGLRFYKGAGNGGTHTANLWTSSGSLLATTVFTSETASGWQEVAFPTPVPISANTIYVASYHAPNGHYAYTSGYFANPVSNSPLQAPASGAVGGNGLYRYGSTGFPTQTYNSTNYWVDVVFNTTVPPDTTPPAVSAVSPPAGATGVSTTAAVVITFNEEMDPATINTTTVELRNATNGLVPASVTYAAGNRTATLTPSSALSNGSNYTIRVLGGTSEPRAKDVAGNALVTTFSSSFTTAADITPPTVVSVNPPAGATGVANTAVVTVAFSEDVNPATISTSTIELRAGSLSTPIAATVTYNSSTRTATLTPSSALLYSTTYTIRVHGGSADPRVKDLAGNALAADFTSSFTTVSAPPSVAGQWAGPFQWPYVAVHAMLLKTGEVLIWDGPDENLVGGGTGDAGDTATLWNPNTMTFTPVPNFITNIFCAGHAVLADGRILVMGGHQAAGIGLRDANIFDPITRQWTALPPMKYARWYPTATTLADGRVLVVSGSTDCQACLADTPEIYDPATNQWTTLQFARRPIELYPYNFLLPNGKVVAVGGYDAPSFVTQTLDVATQTWSVVDPRPLDGGSAVMYLPGKIMKSGTARQAPGVLAKPDTWVIDMNAATPAWRQTAPMNFPRVYHTLTTLPDGSVLVTGGGRNTDTLLVNQAVLEAELWSPATETWTPLAAMQTPRLYHSIALLLPDGRVLVAGSGRTEGVDQLSAEIYSPPYLFKGARPTIASAPSNVSYGSRFIVGTPDGSSIASVSMIRTGSVTHTFQADQRFLPLTFRQVSGGLEIDAPADTNVAPPGIYMLFLVNSNGVPSVAAFVNISAMSIVRDINAANFAAGSPDSNAYISDSTDEVILKPAVVSDFSGASLPAGWSATAWQPGGSAAVSGGVLRVDGARANSDALRTYGSIEFVATFGLFSGFQHAGLGITLNETPYAIFSTGNGGRLWARTHDGTTETATLLNDAWLNSPHIFRIDWTPTSVTYSVDDVVVATHAVAISASMRPIASDYAFGGETVQMDWVRMSPYPSAGTFTSRVFDAGSSQANWGPVWWDGYLPSGTGIALSVRTGNTPVPDGSWSAFTPIPVSGALIGRTARYAQYRATLNSANASETPALWGVAIGYSSP